MCLCGTLLTPSYVLWTCTLPAQSQHSLWVCVCTHSPDTTPWSPACLSASPPPHTHTTPSPSPPLTHTTPSPPHTHNTLPPPPAPPQGVTSYVIVRPLCTALALITSQFGVYSEGELSPNKAYPYLAMATNLSQVRDGLTTAAAAACASRPLMLPHILTDVDTTDASTLHPAQAPAPSTTCTCQRCFALLLSFPTLLFLSCCCCCCPPFTLPPPHNHTDVGAVLPGDVLPRLQGRAAPHTAPQQVHLHQGRCVPDLLAGPLPQRAGGSGGNQGGVGGWGGGVVWLWACVDACGLKHGRQRSRQAPLYRDKRLGLMSAVGVVAGYIAS